MPDIEPSWLNFSGFRNGDEFETVCGQGRMMKVVACAKEPQTLARFLFSR